MAWLEPCVKRVEEKMKWISHNVEMFVMSNKVEQKSFHFYKTHEMFIYIVQLVQRMFTL